MLLFAHSRRGIQGKRLRVGESCLGKGRKENLLQRAAGMIDLAMFIRFIKLDNT